MAIRRYAISLLVLKNILLQREKRKFVSLRSQVLSLYNQLAYTVTEMFQ